MGTSALSLMIFLPEIREAYLDSKKGVALVIAQPVDVRVSPIEFWEDAYTDPFSAFGLVDRAVGDCRDLHREIGATLPVVYFVMFDEGAWTSEVMPLQYMSHGGVA